MANVGDATGGHDGTCGFCGTSVRPDFVTCTGCGATWKSLVNGLGRLKFQSALPSGAFLGFLSIGVFQSFGAGMLVFIGVALGMAIWGGNTKTTGWYR